MPHARECAHAHIVSTYQLGGSNADRAAADERLRRCAAAAGSFSPGWKGAARRLWRRFRARVMWLAVRACGWSFWADNPIRVTAIRARLAAQTALTALTAIDGPNPRLPPNKDNSWQTSSTTPRTRKAVSAKLE